jgi:hypothetical protein
MKHRIIFALVMGLITTGIVSFTLIIVNRGFASGFTPVWIKSWIIAYFVATPIIILLPPKVQLLITQLFKERRVQ